VKLVQVDIWHYNNAIWVIFKDNAFVVFNNLINFRNETLPLVWAINLTFLNNDIVWCALCVGIELAWLHIDDLHKQ
jgi:hypothetical protein